MNTRKMSFLTLIFVLLSGFLFASSPEASWEKPHQEGSVLEKKGLFDEAILKFEESLKVAQSSSAKAAVAKNWIAIGVIETRRGKYVEAMNLFEQVKKLGEELNDTRIVANALIRIGTVQRTQGRYKEGLENDQTALKIGEERNDEELIARALYGIGNFSYFQGDLSDALNLYRRSLEFANEWGDESTISMLLMSTAVIFRTQGSLVEALEYYEKAKSTAETSGDMTTLATVLSNMGVAYKEQGLYDEATKCYRQALTIAEKMGNRLLCAQNLNNLGVLSGEQGFNDKAIHYHQSSMKLSEELGSKRGITLSMNNIGVNYNKLGLYEKALVYFNKALSVREELGDKWGMTSTLLNIGSNYEHQKNYDAAIQSYQKSLKIAEEVGDKPRISIVTLNLGATLLSKSLYAESQQYFERTLEIGREMDSKKMMGYALEGIGTNHLLQNQYLQAIEALQKALILAEEIKEPTINWRSSYRLGQAYEKHRERKKALDYYVQAINVIERIRGSAGLEESKAGFLSDKLIVYEDLIRLLYRLHKENPARNYGVRAFEYSERAKARALLDSLAEARLRKGLTKDEISAEATILRKISKVQAQLWKEKITDKERKECLLKLQEAEEELDRFVLDLRIRNRKYTELQYPKPYGLTQIREKLDAQTALLEFFVGEEESFVFAITQKEFQVVSLAKKIELKELVEKYTACISGSSASSRTQHFQCNYPDLARELSLQLIDPVQKTIGRKQNWIVVLDGVLHYVPLETLIMDGDKLVLKQYRISYAPSATIWANLKVNQKVGKHSPNEFLAFADPELMPVNSGENNSERVEESWLSQLGKLKYSKLEVEGIGSLYTEKGLKLYLGKDASEENLKAETISNYKMIHLATHALVDEEFPRRSGIVLSQARKGEEDGVLQVQEILNLDLNAELVVLSACETGLGKLVDGEGIVGLMRAFLYAGTKNLVVTLWKVDDKSTADLMKSFYIHMKSGKSKTEALRQAKLDLIQSAESGSGYAAYINPYYWGAFELVGSGN